MKRVRAWVFRCSLTGEKSEPEYVCDECQSKFGWTDPDPDNPDDDDLQVTSVNCKCSYCE